jgi:hypothetical protein
MGCGASAASEASQVEAILAARKTRPGVSYLTSDPESLTEYKNTMSQIGAMSSDDEEDGCETRDGVLRKAKQIRLNASSDTLSGRSALRSVSSSDRDSCRLTVSFKSFIDRQHECRSMDLSTSDIIPGLVSQTGESPI